MYSHNWEANNTKKILKALEYYSEKKKLNKKDIYLIDIGANVGWYTYFLGKIGYNIMSFEASKINNYILYKNYCLNRDINVTIINKGLDVEDKKCKLKIVSYNIGDGMILCDNRDKLILDFNGEIFDDIELTKLGKYTKFLSEKNLAFIKLDVEGAEGTVFEGGKEIIDKYHVPFIMMEFEVRLLESHGTKVLNFLEFFENNGYKFSLIDFFSKEYISSSELIQIKRNKNLFVVYEKILE
jgi:FkbM family methyltransferase